jgi:hypothetical protein
VVAEELALALELTLGHGRIVRGRIAHDHMNGWLLAA